ncbi:hypothetical protein [Anoxybacillus eryuanensis]|uniref:hypothetical protein n=1 Tax=Anoxybacillus eryuanensis TaxID=651866 RepID=UPI003EF42B03
MFKLFHSEFGYLKWGSVACIIYFYSLRSKEYIIFLSHESKKAVNVWDFMIAYFGNPYLITYFIFPFLCFYSVFYIISYYEDVSLIRLGSLNKWGYKTTIRFLEVLIKTFFIWLVVSLILLKGVSFSSSWSALSKEDVFLIEAQTIQKFISSPLLSFFYQILLIFFFFICLHIIFCSFYLLIKRVRLFITFVFSVWIYAILSFKRFPSHMGEFKFFSYFSLAQSLETFDHLLVPFFTFLIIVLILIVLWNRRSIITFFIEYKYYISFLLTVVVVMWVQQTKDMGTSMDFFCSVFLGITKHARFLPLLTYMIFYIGFAYVFSVFWQQEKKNMIYYEFIRYGSAYKWLKKEFLSITLFSLIYLVFLFVASLTISLLKGVPLLFSISFQKDVAVVDLLYHFFINGYLQIVFYVLFVMFFYFLNQNVYGIALLSIMTIWSTSPFIPFKLNSLGYVLEGKSVYLISLVLLLWLIAIIMSICALLRRRIF